MQSVPTKFPFTHVYFEQQPAEVRVHCILNSYLISKRPLVTGLAIDGTGSMQSQFGYGPFASNKVRSFGQPLGCFLGSLDKQGGTSIIYWGTGDPGSIQSLGFRKASDWSSFSFSPPNNYGRKESLCPGLNWFFSEAYLNDRKLEQSEQEGIYLFLLYGPIMDYDDVSNHIKQLTQDMLAGRRKKSRLVFVGLHSLDYDWFQIRSLVSSYSDVIDPPLVSSLFLREHQDLFDAIEEALMIYFTIGSSGSIRNMKGGIIQDYPDGLPGAFQFNLPNGSSGFSIKLDSSIYSQELPL
jgi:hypothetical protein